MSRILVVDDDPQLRGMLTQALAAAGYQVAEAADGAQALAKLRREPVALVVCDLFMPGQDGLETIRDLRRDYPGVPVIAISGGGYDGQLDLLSTAKLLGAVHTFQKPFRIEVMVQAIQQALGQ